MILPLCETAVCAVLMFSGALEAVTAMPQINDMPLYATSYSWELGGHNCDSDCGEVAIGLKTSPELLGRTAACPFAWLGRITTTVITLADGSEWWCIDTFGDAENRRPLLLDHAYHGEVWVVRLDFAVSDPWNFKYNQELLYGWSIEWRPVRELAMDGE